MCAENYVKIVQAICLTVC